MRICLPTAGNSGMEESVFSHFGSANYFVIYDTETKKIQTIENSNDHSSHGSCNPLAVLGSFNIDAILTSGMGRRAVQILNIEGIKAYLLNGNTVADAIQKFEAGELPELTAENACGGHGCH